METLRERIERELGIKIALAPDLPMGEQWQWLPAAHCLRVRSLEVLEQMAGLPAPGTEGPHGHALYAP